MQSTIIKTTPVVRLEGIQRTLKLKDGVTVNGISLVPITVAIKATIGGENKYQINVVNTTAKDPVNCFIFTVDKKGKPSYVANTQSIIVGKVVDILGYDCVSNEQLGHKAVAIASENHKLNDDSSHLVFNELVNLLGYTDDFDKDGIGTRLLSDFDNATFAQSFVNCVEKHKLDDNDLISLIASKVPKELVQSGESSTDEKEKTSTEKVESKPTSKKPA